MSLVTTLGAKVLKLNDTGPEVKELQLALAAVGFSLKGTGWFGPSTDTAVETFQRKAGLTVDGEVGQLTAEAIDAARGKGVNSKILGVPAVEISRPLWLEAGIKLIGTKEMPGSGDSKTIIDWAKEEGPGAAAIYTHDSIPWCALYANHCLTLVGLKGTGTFWALDFAGKWPSIKLAGPAVGAFAPMLRNGGGHIIQVVGKDQHGNIRGLGGNQSDQVSIIPFPVARLNKGFWWPKSVNPPTTVGLATLPVVLSNGKVSTKEA